MMKKYGVQSTKKINKNNIKYLSELSEYDVNIIVKEFDSILEASRGLAIPEKHLVRALKNFKYNEFENAYDFIIRSKRNFKKTIKRFLFTEEQTRKILNGNMNITRNERQKYLYSLIHFGYKTCRCDKCGFITEKRVKDGAYPLLMTFKDNNDKNLHIDNIDVNCYNCFHTYIGDIAYATKYPKEYQLKFDMSNTPQIQQIDDQWDIGWNIDPDILIKAEFDAQTTNKKTAMNKKLRDNPDLTKKVDVKAIEKLKQKFQENISKLEEKL